MHKNIKQNDYSRYAANRDVISLFSGAMGLDIGLGKAGLNVVIGQDFDAACVKTMKANGHKVLGGDIREIQPQQLLDMTGLAGRTIFDLWGTAMPAFFNCRKKIRDK